MDYNYVWNMVGYKIVSWPEVQELMEFPGFEENATLIVPNEGMGIDDNTYLINKTWYYKYE